MADDTNTAERESFEAWASQSVGRVWRDTAPGRTEDYLDASTNLCWRAWLARASLAASAGSEPVAWAIFAENGNIRMWSAKPDQVKTCATETGQKPVPLYADPSPRNGMVLVPREPTPEMLRAGDQKTWVLPSLDCWRAMLDAAPANPSPPEGMAGWTTLPGQLPEPGTPVLLDIGKKYPIRAMWAPAKTLEASNDSDAVGDYDEATDTYYCPEGWYEWNQHEETHWFVTETPRAWMPLPASEAKEL